MPSRLQADGAHSAVARSEDSRSNPRARRRRHRHLFTAELHPPHHQNRVIPQSQVGVCCSQSKHISLSLPLLPHFLLCCLLSRRCWFVQGNDGRVIGRGEALHPRRHRSGHPHRRLQFRALSVETGVIPQVLSCSPAFFPFLSGMVCVFTVFRDWGLLQANGSARVRLRGTEVIASVKVRVLAIFSALYKFSML